MSFSCVLFLLALLIALLIVDLWLVISWVLFGGNLCFWPYRSQCKRLRCLECNIVMGLFRNDRPHGWLLWSCGVVGGGMEGYCMAGLAETVEILVCCVWRRIVDIHDFRLSIPLSLLSVFGLNRIWIDSFPQRVHLCQSWPMHWSSLHFDWWSAS